MRVRRVLGAGASVAAVAAVIGLSGGSGAIATHEPADKVSAAGSETEVIRATPGTNVVTLLSEKVKTAKPTDLILGVTAECAITTDLETIGSETQQAEGTVRVWVEIDGKPVPVSSEDTDGGRVVFCNRMYERTTQLGTDDEQDSVKTFLRTRSANGFNWMALNVGSATHLIEVKAELTTSQTQRASAIAVVGNRTLIVEPTKATNDEHVSAVG